MRTRLDAARLLLYRAAWLFDTGTPNDVAISLAKAYVSEAAIENGLEAQRLYGAMGTLADSPAARFLNDMLPFRTLSGPTEVHYQIAARLMQRTGA
jgi:alkylation response protein AidB-like acyl-CoA dehydrogenase